MAGKKSAIIGLIGIVLGAAGLGYGIFSTINLQGQISQTEINIDAKAYLTTGYFENDDFFNVLRLDTLSYDPGNNFNLSIYSYIAPINGTYLITGTVTFSACSDGDYYRSIIYVEGTQKAEKFLYAAGGSGISLSVTTIMSLSAGERVEIGYYKQDGINRYLPGGEKNNYLAISLL